MTFKIPHFIILSAIYLFAAGCKSYLPHQANTSIIKSNQKPCATKSTEVKVFMAIEEIKFKYHQIGVVEFHSNYNAHKEAKIDYLKNEAWMNCADAIINISSDYKYGVAVKIIKDKDFYQNYQSQTDTSFAAYVKKDQAYLHDNFSDTPSEKVASETIMATILLFGGIMLLPFLVANENMDGL